MKKTLFDMHGNASLDDISAGMLPDEFAITDPRTYIQEMRSTFLRVARKENGLSLEDVSRTTEIPIEDISRIENGKVSERDLMSLSRMADLYHLELSQLLYLFKLAERPSQEETEKLAAYHTQNIDKATQQELQDFLVKLKDFIP